MVSKELKRRGSRKYRTFKLLKTTLITESKKQSQENWVKKVNSLKNIYKEPKAFWEGIKRL